MATSRFFLRDVTNHGGICGIHANLGKILCSTKISKICACTAIVALELVQDVFENVVILALFFWGCAGDRVSHWFAQLRTTTLMISIIYQNNGLSHFGFDRSILLTFTQSRNVAQIWDVGVSSWQFGGVCEANYGTFHVLADVQISMLGSKSWWSCHHWTFGFAKNRRDWHLNAINIVQTVEETLIEVVRATDLRLALVEMLLLLLLGALKITSSVII